jgi:hypothetical protein
VGYFRAFGVVGISTESVVQDLKLLEITRSMGEVREPIHESGEAAFFGHERSETLAGEGANEEMTREDALQIEARVFHPSDQIVTKPGGVVACPGASEFF